ncbi:MAG: Imm42 family immunity protein [Methylococcales bacterium]|nr:Imm42 family immunity protein [Methylococcales bacterium]
MLVGNKDVFAVEYELDENINAWMYGKVCYWINNIQIGEYDLGTSLRDVFFALKYSVYDCENRDGGRLCELSPQEIFYHLNETIFGNNEYSGAVLDTPARFNIGLQIDVFDNWKIFLVDCDNKSIFFFKMLTEENVHHFVTPKRYFDTVIKKFYSRLEATYDSTNKLD